MTKAMQKQIKETAITMAKEFNPYKNRATEYFIGYTPMYLWNGKSYTAEELDNAYIETAIKDITNGYNERMVGYYDKWYRYNHADEGRAYDMGQKMAIKNPKCSNEFHIIECN